jgi:hypothetical protein
VLSLDEEAISPSEDAQRMKANNRKTSSWKGFKSQFSKAEMKIKSTFGDSFSKERKAVDGTIISPTELSPESVESGESTPVEDERSENMANLIRNIEELGAECDKEIAATSSATTTTTATAMKPTGVSDKKDKRVDFVEEPCKKISFQTNEGAGISRPTELSFGSGGVPPTAPPRMKKEKRLERLLSVPNIKLNKVDQNRLLNLRKTSNMVEQRSSSATASSSTAATASASSSIATTAATKNKGNFMRRFSKYQFHCINQSSVKRVCVCFSLPNLIE